jgi:hypothetical protein
MKIRDVTDPPSSLPVDPPVTVAVTTGEIYKVEEEMKRKLVKTVKL